MGVAFQMVQHEIHLPRPHHSASFQSPSIYIPHSGRELSFYRLNMTKAERLNKTVPKTTCQTSKHQNALAVSIPPGVS